jgi:hypothetical protein
LDAENEQTNVDLKNKCSIQCNFLHKLIDKKDNEILKLNEHSECCRKVSHSQCNYLHLTIEKKDNEIMKLKEE